MEELNSLEEVELSDVHRLIWMTFQKLLQGKDNSREK